MKKHHYYHDTEKWEVRKFINLFIESKITPLSYQRSYKRTRGCEKRIIKVCIEEMLQPIMLVDLKSSLDYAISADNKDDIEYFSEYIEAGYIYGVHDGHQRSISAYNASENFKEFCGKYTEQDFYDSILDVCIMYGYSQNELIESFKEINSGKPVSTIEILFGINNNFNNNIKNMWNLFYDLFEEDTSLTRKNLYNIIIKIYKICGYYDVLYNDETESPLTSKDNLIHFVEKNIDIKVFDNLLPIFNTWHDYLKDFPGIINLYNCTNLFFILHVTIKNNILITKEEAIRETMSLSNSRLSSLPRYKKILERYGC